MRKDREATKQSIEEKWHLDIGETTRSQEGDCMGTREDCSSDQANGQGEGGSGKKKGHRTQSLRREEARMREGRESCTENRVSRLRGASKERTKKEPRGKRTKAKGREAIKERPAGRGAGMRTTAGEEG